MRRFAKPWLVWVAVALFVAQVAAALIVTPGHQPGVTSAERFGLIMLLVVSVVFTATGALLATRRPLHPIGWMLLAFGVLNPTWVLGIGLAQAFEDAGRLTAAAWAETLPYLVAAPALLFIPAVLLVYPDGRLLSPRWRAVGWSMAPIALAGSIAGLLNGGFGGDYTEVVVAVSPLRDDFGSLGDLLSGLFWGGLGAMFVASIISLILRFRRSHAEKRQQIKWVAVAGVYSILALGVLAELEALQAIAWLTGLAAIPVSIAVAILKYRLYDIDVVINKAVVLATLAIFIGAIYVGVVVGIGSLFGSGDESDFGLGIAATALVAIAFQPVRRRTQRLANRAVYGSRATPYEVLANFSRRAAEATDDELLARIPRLIVDGTGAAEATLWVRSGEHFRAAASWPEEVERPGTPLGFDEDWKDPSADHSLPVFHDGELLGGLSLVKARGEALAPAEEELLENLAAGMGLALRNARLTARLREQVHELEASRERILAAADEARRALEHDLDSGPQQQLVALKVMLGPAQKQASQAGATKTAEILAQLESDAGEAITAVRDFSGGVYPPLLEAEGLAVAITQHTQKAALPIAVDANGIGRYSRELEAAVYFTILEALQNITKYADASAVSLVLKQADGDLSFEVTDDGAGFDPSTVTAGSGLSNMADRLDAVGGTWNLESAPGSGTLITGTVPIGDRVGV